MSELFHANEPRLLVYKIDRADHLIELADDWDTFAKQNDGETILREQIEGKSLWQFITHAETCNLYQSLAGKVRNNGGEYKVNFRCDGPDCRRHIELTLSPGHNSEVIFRSQVVGIEQRAPVPFPKSIAEEDKEFIQMCSWCKKIMIAEGHWAEIEVAIEKLSLFARIDEIALTHTICPTCQQTLDNYDD